MPLKNSEHSIKLYESGTTQLKVWKDGYDRYITVVARQEDLESNVLYHGYNRSEALAVFDECLERFDIDDVDSLDEIQWSADRS